MMNNSDRESLVTFNRLDVIVRLHDSSRLAELKRAMFSLICQDYRPLTINLVTQRFGDGETEQVLSELDALLKLDPSVELRVWNYSQTEPKDARSALLNLGIRNSSGRYFAILDYDDVIYSDGYSKLIRELHNSGCAIAFGKVVMKFIDVFEDAIICERVQHRFSGNDVLDLFRDNFCPIHSFVIDREKVDSNALSFDEQLDKLEDYNFLIRICARYLSSFKLKDSVVGEYYAKNDGSNTIMLTSAAKAKHIVAWTHARDGIERLRKTCIVSEEVQAAVGSPVINPSLTVRQTIDLLAGTKAKLL
jgi:hypothetical protein